jgi:hypothetical protein
MEIENDGNRCMGSANRVFNYTTSWEKLLAKRTRAMKRILK